MMNKQLTRYSYPARSQGFSLIEMMLAMLIGTIILAGIFTVFANTREAQRTMDQHLTMVGDGRFAIELLTYDLRHSSIYGGTNLATLIECRAEDFGCAVVPARPANDCLPGWSHDLDIAIHTPTAAELAVYVANGCPIDNHVANTDVIVVRYADSNPVADADLVANTAYVRSNYRAGKLFVGTDYGVFGGDTGDAFTQNYQLITRAYYISSYTDTVGDGIPSLRRIELEAALPDGTAGTVLNDQVLMPGVENLQIQYGIDTDGDGEINKYVDASSVSVESINDADNTKRATAKTDWRKIKAAKVWVLMRTEHEEKPGFDNTTPNGGFALGGGFISDADLDDRDLEEGDDRYRRLLLSNVVNMRNMNFTTATMSP